MFAIECKILIICLPRNWLSSLKILNNAFIVTHVKHIYFKWKLEIDDPFHFKATTQFKCCRPSEKLLRKSSTSSWQRFWKITNSYYKSSSDSGVESRLQIATYEWWILRRRFVWFSMVSTLLIGCAIFENIIDVSWSSPLSKKINENEDDYMKLTSKNNITVIFYREDRLCAVFFLKIEASATSSSIRTKQLMERLELRELREKWAGEVK